MQTANSTAHGIRWGIIAGLAYCVLLVLRFSLGVSDLLTFALLTVLGFAAILVLLFFCGSVFRKKSGGYLEMKEAFKVMFIAVLLFEFFYTAFSFFYLRFINPTFFENFRLNNERFLKTVGQSQADNDKILAMIDQWGAQAKSINAFDFLKSYLYNVAITGVFALLFSFILKRRSKTLPNENFNQV